MAKHPKAREQRKAVSAARLAATRKAAIEGEETTVPVWYHAQYGARIQFDMPSYSGPWSVAARLDVIKDRYAFSVVGGQTLPKGFLWGRRDSPEFGTGATFVVYAPIHRRCRDCKAMFEWTAKAQQHLYETLGVTREATATRCQPCARKRRAIEVARAAYAKAVAEIPADTAAPYVRVAKAMLEVLDAGGTLSIDRAIGYCTRARKLGAGASVAAVEAKLRALR